MVSPCYCVVCAVRLQFKILWQGYIKKNKKNFMFYRREYRRNITGRYFTESWKTFTGLCHCHRRIYRRTITRRYFTESCKKITGLCHFHRRLYWWTLTRRYFTESCKKITGVCHNHRRTYRRPIPTDSPTDLRTSRSARMSDTCPSATILMDFPTDQKLWRDFRTFLVRISINYRRYYQRKLMPPTTINFRW
jgi:hypothetical protein